MRVSNRLIPPFRNLYGLELLTSRRRVNMVGVNMVLAEYHQIQIGPSKCLQNTLKNTCKIPSKHHQRVQFAICMRFDGILLKPCLLQPCLHVAGLRLLLFHLSLPVSPFRHRACCFPSLACRLPLCLTTVAPPTMAVPPTQLPPLTPVLTRAFDFSTCTSSTLLPIEPSHGMVL